jgi:hypothetical protein
LNDLGWKLFNALFPRTLESFSRRFAVGFADLKIHRFILEQLDGEAKALNGLIQILAIDRLRAIVNVGNDSGSGQSVFPCLS